MTDSTDTEDSTADVGEAGAGGYPASFEVEGRLISFRSETAGDDEFLHRVYAETREAELAPTGWSDAQKDAFTRMQFRAQRTDYRKNYPSALFGIILVDGLRAGRLYLYRTVEEVQILDIALLSEFRNGGIGGAIMRLVQQDASESLLPVTIYVEKFNPAFRLYTRLGFLPTGDSGIYLHMTWRPADRSDELADST